jgi:hypothetical protein
LLVVPFPSITLDIIKDFCGSQICGQFFGRLNLYLHRPDKGRCCRIWYEEREMEVRGLCAGEDGQDTSQNVTNGHSHRR